METATASEQTQKIFTPVAHFSMRTVQRGTIIILGTLDKIPGATGIVGKVTGLFMAGMPATPIMLNRSVETLPTIC
ncbi:MAG TPA: hypothetical protein PKA06_14510 [Gemmatales bacterium]|nr:hypothetical protein [Gemmatales bacterium]